MKTTIAKVKEFMESCGQPTPPIVTVLDDKRKDFRMRLIDEEVEELRDALQKNDEVEERDAIADTIIVLLGLAIERGYAHKLIGDIDTICNNNLTKQSSTMDEALETIDEYAKKGIPVYAKKMPNGKYTIFRSFDNKVMKTKNHKKVQLSPKG